MRMHPVTKERRFHSGMDFLIEVGSPVYATANGTVKDVSFNERAGKLITIAHEGGFETTYQNLSLQNVAIGDLVSKGDQIGETGKSGEGKKAHLHYEIRLNNKPVNPIDYLP